MLGLKRAPCMLWCGVYIVDPIFIDCDLHGWMETTVVRSVVTAHYRKETKNYDQKARDLNSVKPCISHRIN